MESTSHAGQSVLGQLWLSVPSLCTPRPVCCFVEGGGLLCPGQSRRRTRLSSAFRNRFVLNSRTALWEEGSCRCSYRLSQGIFGKDDPGCSSHQ